MSTSYYKTFPHGTCDACKQPNQPVNETHAPGWLICMDCLHRIWEIDTRAASLSDIRREMRTSGIPVARYEQ